MVKFLQGLLFIFCFSILIYSQLIRKSFDIPLNTNETIKFIPYFFCIFIMMCIICCILLISIRNTLKTQKNIKKNQINQKNLFNNIKEKVLNNYLIQLIKKVLKNILLGYGVIFDWLGPNNTVYLVKLAKIVPSWSKYYIRIIVSIEILPRIIILMIFYIEIYHKHIYYYFFSLILLVIPLFLKCIIFILTDIGSRVLPELNKMLIFTKKEIVMEFNDIPKNFYTQNIQLHPDYSYLHLETFLLQFYYPLIQIGPEIETNFNPIHTKIRLHTIFCYYLLQTVGWGYILFSLIYIY